MVKASASRAEDPGFESRWRWDFSGSSHTSDSKVGTLVATLPGAWRYGVSTGTVRSGVSILWLGEVEVGSATSISVWQQVKLSEQIRPWDTLACCWDVKQPGNKQTYLCLSDWLASWYACWYSMVIALVWIEALPAAGHILNTTQYFHEMSFPMWKNSWSHLEYNSILSYQHFISHVEDHLGTSWIQLNTLYQDVIPHVEEQLGTSWIQLNTFISTCYLPWCCLLVAATCECISGTDLLRQVYLLPHWDRSCRSFFPFHPVTVYGHRASQSQHWPYNARRLAG